MRRSFLLMSITLLSVASAMAQEEFKFEVTTTAANQVFAIPVSGGNGGKTYNWNINWGDGNTSTGVNGTGSTTSAGITHTYATAGTYQITLTPAGGNDRWLAAFGFYGYTNGANVQTNKNLVTKVISPITPLMTRTQAEITANTTSPPNYEWYCTFYGCTNLTMGPAFTFSTAWNSITTVGGSFASYMFSNCSGAAFTMNTVFNLPQNLTTIGSYFATNMFVNCSGAAFQVNNVFTFPRLAQTEIDKTDMFYRTFYNLGTNTTQNRTAASIINGNPTPSSNRQTFSGSGCFADRAYIPVNWGGDGLSKTFTVTYNYNGATGGNTTPSNTVTFYSAYGSLPSPTKQYTITYNYNGSAQANGSDTYNPIFSGWYLDAGFVNAITATTIVTTFSDHTIYAKWNGALTLPTPAANAGYTFAGWYKEASCVNFVGNAGDSYIPTANVTLFAQWIKVKDHTITATAGSNGSISPSGTVTVSHGSNSPYFYFAANAGYTIDKVRIDNVENATAKTDGFYMFTNVTEDHQIYVSFTSLVGIVGTQLIASFPRIYPNPTNGQLTIASPNPKGGEQATIEIYDVIGQVVFTSQLSKLSPETTIDISHLANGLYFLKVGGKMIKVVKE